jgi:hypothetical protein
VDDATGPQDRNGQQHLGILKLYWQSPAEQVNHGTGHDCQRVTNYGNRWFVALS